MKKIITTPDKTIKLDMGDYVDIYIRKSSIRFDFACDGCGNSFSITKEELREMCK